MTTARPLVFACPRCQTPITVAPEHAGTKVECPSCRKAIKVPGQAPTATSTDDLEWDAPPRPPDGVPHTGANAAADAPRIESPSPSSPAALPDDDLAVAPVPSAPLARPADRWEFGFECPICRTRLYASSDEVGKKKKCPDCYTQATVPPPPPRRPLQRAVEHHDGELRLSEPVEVPKYRPLIDDEGTRAVAAALASERPAPTGSPEPAGPAAPPRPRRSEGEEELEKAQKQLEARERETPELPPRPFFDRLFDFLRDPQAVFRGVLVAIGLAIGVSCARSGVAMMNGGALEQVVSLGLFMFAFVAGAFTLGLGGACAVVIVQETAHGKDVLQGWPGVNFTEWLSDSLYTASAVFLAGLPGVLVATLLSCGGVPVTFGLVILAACLYGFVPLLLLSMLEAATPLTAYSKPIWESLLKQTALWKQFYRRSAIGAGAVLIVGLGLRMNSVLVTGLFSAALVALVFVYFRLVGRLAWCLQEAASAAEESEPK